MAWFPDLWLWYCDHWLWPLALVPLPPALLCQRARPPCHPPWECTDHDSEACCSCCARAASSAAARLSAALWAASAPSRATRTDSKSAAAAARHASALRCTAATCAAQRGIPIASEGHDHLEQCMVWSPIQRRANLWYGDRARRICDLWYGGPCSEYVVCGMAAMQSMGNLWYGAQCASATLGAWQSVLHTPHFCMAFAMLCS